MAAVFEQISAQVVLRGVSWQLYEQMTRELADSHAAHLAFDKGILEIIMPSPRHEMPNRVLSDLVMALCVECGMNARNVGSMTFKRAPLQGCEPDTAYYLQNEPAIRGQSAIDLASDPPPDLVIEIDITHPSLDKLPIYAGLRVPEVWRYDGEQVIFYGLSGRHYQETKESRAFPFLSDLQATELLESGLREDQAAWLRQVYRWARTQCSETF